MRRGERRTRDTPGAVGAAGSWRPRTSPGAHAASPAPRPPAHTEQDPLPVSRARPGDFPATAPNGCCRLGRNRPPRSPGDAYGLSRGPHPAASHPDSGPAPTGGDLGPGVGLWAPWRGGDTGLADPRTQRLARGQPHGAGSRYAPAAAAVVSDAHKHGPAVSSTPRHPGTFFPEPSDSLLAHRRHLCRECEPRRASPGAEPAGWSPTPRGSVAKATTSPARLDGDTAGVRRPPVSRLDSSVQTLLSPLPLPDPSLTSRDRA